MIPTRCGLREELAWGAATLAALLLCALALPVAMVAWLCEVTRGAWSDGAD